MRLTSAIAAIALMSAFALSCGGDDDSPGSADGGGEGPCSADVDCDDGAFCNGVERCDAEEPTADANGCVADPEPVCGAGERCNEDTDACLVGGCDADMDGVDSVECAGTDCDDEDPNRFPGNTEICDADDRDEDCDATTFGFRDADADGVADAACCNSDAAGTPTCGTDCNDTAPGTNPSAPEVCDEFDNDCDGNVDEGVLMTFYRDEDGDGFGREMMPDAMQACLRPTGFAETMDDCNDDDGAIHPAAPEMCDAGMVDENCDGVVNPAALCTCTGTETRMCMGTAGVCLMGTEMCSGGTWGACSIAPGTEVCDEMDDEDCDGLVDEGMLMPCYADADGDFYPAVGAVRMDRCSAPGRPDTGGCPVGTTNRRPLGMDIDCNDSDSAIRPGGVERCSTPGVDDDCDGTVDESGAGDAANWYRDSDGDGAGDPTMLMRACVQPPGHVASNGDCNDGDPAIRPGAAELCNGMDEDCDMRIDEGAAASCPMISGTTFSCTMGMCVVATCPPNMDDCNMTAADGCEVDLRDTLAHCGMCMSSCHFECQSSSCQEISELTAGANHSCAVYGTPSRIACWGDNDNGQIGDGTMMRRLTAVDIGFTGTGVDAGADHTCAIDGMGRAHCWGDNAAGQLGNGNMMRQVSPARVSLLSSVTDISGGTSHTCAIDSGTTYCWGANNFGQLGLGTTSPRTTPGAIAGLSNATVVSAGNAHSCARLSTGAVQCWGLDINGQLGDGSSTTGHGGCGAVNCATAPVAVSGISNATDVVAGVLHSCALLSTGVVQCWGSRLNGRLGSGSSSGSATSPEDVMGLSDAAAIAGGVNHTCARRTTGRVVCWGVGAGGRLGNAGVADSNVPVNVTGLTNGTNVLSAGGDQGCATRTNGSVWCWGENSLGSVGDNTMTMRTSPVALLPL